MSHEREFDLLLVHCIGDPIFYFVPPTCIRIVVLMCFANAWRAGSPMGGGGESLSWAECLFISTRGECTELLQCAGGISR